MRRNFLIPLALLTGFYLILSAFGVRDRELPFFVPQGWPAPVHDFSRNKVTENGFILGSRLFYDPLLSRDSTISCASCHLSYTAFTHVDHQVSHGIYGRKGTRNSLALINLAWMPAFMWDGSVSDLEQQALFPLRHPAEMDQNVDSLIGKLRARPDYKELFFDAYGDSSVSTARLLNALSQFGLMLVSYNSKFDSVMRKETNVHFSPQEQSGYGLFLQHCNACHQEPLFTNNTFQNNGLPLDSAYLDLGRMKVTKKAEDARKFKVPTLRNIAVSSPYFHDGRVNKLTQVLDHYSGGIVVSPNLAAELQQPISLSKQDKKDLIAFLKTLTDFPFLYNRAFQYDFSFQNNNH